MSCVRCGGAVVAGQEYCLECGLRLPGHGRLGPRPVDRRRLAASLLFAGVVAVAGATAAIVLTHDPKTRTTISTAIGGSVTQAVPAAADGPRLVRWPRAVRGWTIVLVSVPKVDGRDAAVARADQARQRGLPKVGVLDSSRYGSLHPGYWIVFTGVYDTEPEAAGALQKAKNVQRTARTQLVVSQS